MAEKHCSMHFILRALSDTWEMS